MKVDKQRTDNQLEVAVTGRIDTTTAPQLEEEVKASIEGVTDLKIDFSGVEYISSAGLRVLLSCQKIMNSQGSMVMTGVRESVMEIFEVTGFSDILTIE